MVDTLSQSTKEAFWAIPFILSVQGYGENKLPHSPKWIHQVIFNADSSNYGVTTWIGMNTVRTHLRTLPTNRPFYLDFNRAGEGFPFDYLQNSALPVNTPVHILNQSQDKAWLLIDSHHALGWIPATQVSHVDSSIQNIWMNSLHVTPIREPISILDTLDQFITQAYIGAIFPLIDSTTTHWVIGVVVKDDSRCGQLKIGRIPKNQAIIKPWPLTMNHAVLMTNLFLHQPYGWGGLFNNRDCSAMIKDFFTPFGIWLPRHSKAQALFTPFKMDLSNLKAKQKQTSILDQGIPYISLL